MRFARLVVVALAVATTGCSTIIGYGKCADVPASRLALAPRTLSATGLFRDVRAESLRPGVMPFQPRFQLWSDGATKRRWIALPPGSTIDTSDMDAWQFPTGTKLWKELTRDGVRIETRYLEKTGTGADDWLAVAYVWRDDGTDAIIAPEGAVDARGTPHDVPAARKCMGCHGGSSSRVLGFSAIQLPSSTLETLALEHALSRPAPPSTIPGNETEVAALGYLHANCAHCHNARRPAASGPRCFDPRTTFDLALRTSELATVEATAVYRTVDDELVHPGDPAGSALFRRVAGAGLAPRMPALGTETIDPAGVELLRRWILSRGPAIASVKWQSFVAQGNVPK